MASYIYSAYETVASYIPSIPYLSSGSTTLAASTEPLLSDSDRPQAGDALPTIFNEETCTQKGLFEKFGKGGVKDVELYFEIHGKGEPVENKKKTQRVVFIMGLNNSSFSWKRQVDYLATFEHFQILVFDNRGSGNSSSPTGPYSTSQMANDTYELLKHIGWIEDSDDGVARVGSGINIVGVSMGGMIALELASLYPNLPQTLSLISTTPGPYYGTPPPLTGAITAIQMLRLSSPKLRLELVVRTLFPRVWLEREDNFERIYQETEARYRKTRKQPLMGNLSQTAAVITHSVSPARMKEINDNSKIKKILIMTGDDDNMVDPRNSTIMAKNISRAEYIQLTETGHAIHLQRSELFAEILERVWDEGEEEEV